jgi:hypothetical protein
MMAPVVILYSSLVHLFAPEVATIRNEQQGPEAGLREVDGRGHHELRRAGSGAELDVRVGDARQIGSERDDPDRWDGRRERRRDVEGTTRRAAASGASTVASGIT